MSINLGSNSFGLYLGSTKISEAYVGNVKVFSSNSIPDNTVRLMTTLSTGTPTSVTDSSSFFNGFGSTTDINTNKTTITKVSDYIWDVTISFLQASPTSIQELFKNSFTKNTYVKVIGMNLPSNIANAYGTFRGCTKLLEINNDGLSNCRIGNIKYYLYGASALKKFNKFTMNFVAYQGSYVDYAFYNCKKVESGALEMYNYLKANSFYIDTARSNTFKYCGSNTTTGAAELAQIPTSWGGTKS